MYSMHSPLENHSAVNTQLMVDPVRGVDDSIREQQELYEKRLN